MNLKMETVISEDKLILNAEMFLSVRTYIRAKKTSAEIIAKIEDLLKRGANINACDRNDSDNTILHIAVQNDEKDVVLHLLQKSGYVLSKKDRQKALTLALQKDTIIGKELAVLFEQNSSVSSISDNILQQQTQYQENSGNKDAESIISNVRYTYAKREGTSGVSGQFYETKLLSLILHRALHDQDIKEFYLATNVKDLGGFDDVCFRYDNVTFFMQCKHVENVDKSKLNIAAVRNFKEKFGLGIYFESFLKIKKTFTSNSKDPFFEGSFNKINTYFILYTPLIADFAKKLDDNNQICNKVHNLIYTGKKTPCENASDIFQFKHEEYDLNLLTEYLKYRDMEALGKQFLGFILSKNVQNMMTSELVRTYHPALAQEVIMILKQTFLPQKSKEHSQNQSCTNNMNTNYILTGKFRDEFFESKNKYLVKLKDVFYTEIIMTYRPKIKCTKEEFKKRIQNLYNNTSAETIAELLDFPIKFDNKKSRLYLDIDELPKKLLNSNEIAEIIGHLKNLQVTKMMFNDAISITGKKKLQDLIFQLPNSFGNTDMNAKHKKRLDFLAGIFVDLINKAVEKNRNEDIKIINISNDCFDGPKKTLKYSDLNSNGIGGAVGNLLEFDKDSELFTFNTESDLAENASYVRDKIKELVGKDLSNYKLKLTTDGFPRMSFDVYQYDKSIAEEFLSKLWFYTHQAQEDSVEEIIKKEIDIRYNSEMENNRFLFHVQSDAIFLRFHDMVQKWWKSPTNTFYLTKNSTFYEEAKKGIVNRPILTVLTLMVVRSIKALNVEFNENAIDYLHEFMTKGKPLVLNIVSNAVILSAAKIIQCSEYQHNCSFINLNYICTIPQNDFETMIDEIKLLKDATVVIIAESPIKGLEDTLLSIFQCITSVMNIVVITSETVQIKFENFDFITVKDENLKLCNLASESQAFILDTCEILYQGQKIMLNKIIDDTSKNYINTKLLLSLLKKEKVEIGHEIENDSYNEIKHHYIKWILKRNSEVYTINSLYDIDDSIVLISAMPGMDKTTLLTHLSLATKQIDSKIWIVRVDMALFVNGFMFKMDSQENIVAFLSNVALKHRSGIEKVMFTEINKETVAIDTENIDSDLIELELFIHFYNKGNIIFLFDGFDKIYPRYTKEACALFTTLKEAKKHFWITSNYNSIKKLTEMFGSPYELAPLKYTEKTGLLDRFWTINIKLDKLNHEQYNNISIYLNYILNFFNLKFVVKDECDRLKLAFLSDLFHIIYLMLLHYFQNEAESLSWVYIREKIKKKYNIHSYTTIDYYLQNIHENESSRLSGIPCIKYVAENYFALNISDKFEINLNNDIILDKLNTCMTVLKMYKQFLLIHTKCISKCTLEPRLPKIRNDFLNNHKKILLYVIYKKDDVAQILEPCEIHQIEKTITMIETSELISDPMNSTIITEPTDQLIFAEYFFIQALSELLPHIIKKQFSNLKLDSMCDFLLNAILANSPPSLRNSFYYKIKYDANLPGAVSKENCNRIVFELTLKERREVHNIASDTDDALNDLIQKGLTNIVNVVLKTIFQHLMTMNFIQKFIENFEIDENITDLLDSVPLWHDITKKIKNLIVIPIQIISEKIIELSRNNKNIVIFLKELPRLLPQLIPEILKFFNVESFS